MNNQTVSLSPPNSVVFVVDPTAPYEVPQDIVSNLVGYTRSCISIGTLAEMDGETSITLGRVASIAQKECIFSGELETPGHEIAVIDSSANKLLSQPVRTSVTRIRIYVNDLSEPNSIAIEIV